METDNQAVVEVVESSEQKPGQKRLLVIRPNDDAEMAELKKRHNKALLAVRNAKNKNLDVEERKAAIRREAERLEQSLMESTK